MKRDGKRTNKVKLLNWLKNLSNGQKIALLGVVVAAFTGILSPFIPPVVEESIRNKKIITTLTAEALSPTVTVASSHPTIADCSTYPPRYGFECRQSGWNKTSYYENQAIQAVTTTQFKNENGTSSQVLALTVDFMGSIDKRKKQHRESGEAQVDLDGFPPAGYATKSVDLHGLEIVAWIWAPKGSMGDPNHKNGIQLFIKDGNDKNCYGKWNNIDQEEVWFRVSWQESNVALCDSGFDSSKPKLLGVKIAIGDKSIWTTNDLLTFYVDNVDWRLP